MSWIGVIIEVKCHHCSTVVFKGFKLVHSIKSFGSASHSHIEALMCDTLCVHYNLVTYELNSAPDTFVEIIPKQGAT